MLRCESLSLRSSLCELYCAYTLSGEDTSAANSLYFFLSFFAEELSFDDNWLLRKLSLTENFEVSLWKIIRKSFKYDSCNHKQMLFRFPPIPDLDCEWNFYRFRNIDDRNLVICASTGVLFTRLFRNEGPDFVEVDGGAVELVHGLVEVPHTDLTEVTRVELIEHNSMVVLSTGVTATTRVLAVLADTTMTGTNVTSFFTVLGKSSNL